jgi:hypothetical protein
MAHRARVLSDGNLQALREARRRRIVRKTIREQLTHRVDELLDSTAAEELLAGATLGELEISRTVQKLLAMMAAFPGSRQPP